MLITVSKAQADVLKCYLDIQFTVTEDERNQKIFTSEKLKSENLDTFS